MSRSVGHPDVVIVGGGVIGLSIAYGFTIEGFRPVVLDRREPGKEASWAGAGIIAPGSSRPSKLPMGQLRTRSAQLHADWATALLEETGIDNGYRMTGSVDVAFNDKEDNDLRANAGRWRNEEIAFERLEPRDFARVEPSLNPEIKSAYFVPGRAQIRNPRHLKALTAAIERRGGIIRPGLPCIGFEINRGRLEGVRTSSGLIPCKLAVVSAGPWSESLLATADVKLATPPVKGEIILLKSERVRLRRIIEWEKHYIVPRDDGLVLVGATEVESGFDSRPTASGTRELLNVALKLCPGLADAIFEDSWAGLRPGGIDNRPYIGRAPGLEGLIIATGHRRAGLQLSPATAELVVNLILGRENAIALDQFLPSRSGPIYPESEPFRS